jgi:hypothetical protein
LAASTVSTRTIIPGVILSLSYGTSMVRLHESMGGAHVRTGVARASAAARSEILSGIVVAPDYRAETMRDAVSHERRVNGAQYERSGVDSRLPAGAALQRPDTSDSEAQPLASRQRFSVRPIRGRCQQRAHTRNTVSRCTPSWRTSSFSRKPPSLRGVCVAPSEIPNVSDWMQPRQRQHYPLVSIFSSG